MSQRAWKIYLPVAAAGVLLGGLGAFWMNGAPPDRAPSGNHTAALPAPKSMAPADTIDASPRPQPGAQAAQSQPLRMDDARGLVDLSPPKTASESGDNGERAAVARAPAQGKRRNPGDARDDNAKPGQALNLDVPEDDDRGVAPDPAVTRRAHSEAEPARETRVGTTAPFDFSNRQARATPKVKSYNLFNPDYGLHGFMKQSWINNRIGLQGGLGINDGDRIKSKGDGLGDDLAVGMGVIMAF